MHIVFILIGAAVGAWAGESSVEFLGILAGALVASLLFRYREARARIDRLGKRLDNLEQRQVHAMPIKPAPSKMPAPDSLYEPVPPEQAIAPVTTGSATAEAKTIVHPRVPESPPEPDPLSRALKVARRWLTTGNVPVKVGVIISFFGVAFLLKYAVENSAIEIPIGVRYLGVAAFAAALLILGWRMRARQPAYSLSLQGGGIGVLFLTVYAAFQLHELLPPTMAFGILVLITLAAGALAVLQESRALAILGTTGGFLAPLLVSTGSGDHVALFSYYLVLNCAVLGVAWFRAWRELNLIGFVFTFGVGTLWGIEYYVPELFASTELFLVAHFSFYTAIAVLFALRQRPTLRGFVDGTLVFGTPTIAFALQTQLLPDSEYGLAISAGVVAVFYALLAIALRRTQVRNFDLLTMSFIALGVGFATIAIPLAMDDRWTAIAWALEGAALVWIGVRQNGTLASVTGAGLAFASGAVFINYGWDQSVATPVLNGNYFGGTLLGLSALVSARLLSTDSKENDWQRFISVALLAWGLLWWFGTASVELADHVHSTNVLHFQLLFYAGSFALMARLAGQLQWTSMRQATLLFLPFLLLAFVAYLIEHAHILVGIGVFAWTAAVITHVWLLYVLDENSSRLAPTWHAWGAVFFVAILAFDVRWQVDSLLPNDVWADSAGMFILVAGAAAYLYLRDKVRWPIERCFDGYFTASALLVSGFVLLLVATCINDPGDPAPISYLPILNPFDLLTLAGLSVGWYVIKIADSTSQWSGKKLGTVASWLWGGFAFILATLAVVRAVHHLADVQWARQEIMGSAIAQTSLTIFWAALGVAGMLLGTRRSNRSIYILGGTLMLVVIIKLWVIDFQNNETVFGIASFLGVGLMLLSVGYYSPMPPKPATESAIS